MVTVAIAGGTGSVGKTITEVLKVNPKHKVIILSRKAPENQDADAPVIAVDYGIVDELTEILVIYGVHTVISTIVVDGEKTGAAEINLVRAADNSKRTKRFVSSDWAIHFPTEKDEQLSGHPFRMATRAELSKTNLEWTTFRVGLFSDYYGMPHVKSYLTPLTFYVDIANNAASLPGTGDDPLCFTYSFDVARFVEAALDLPKWEDELFCCGDILTLNELVKLAEDVKGTKFTVAYDTQEKLKKGGTVLQPFIAKFGMWAIRGLFQQPREKSLNQRFTEIKTTSVKEIVGAWEGK